ncbi:GNAT family N-acetyltransferase [Paracrocinitomix mangrovi]|uniref:GNAT family N-acetyltransferase n=1 Tax=Paracrocinitomix mangrovi TaxID=2862509 RepID=UPI001C8F0005|nr:GNAT family N-acetyltransferase [Paracrocinitomix mangrovi]UKN02662.1 GNAT family N-acetyltransferase [Paracrocinitomix mangrovi]
MEISIKHYSELSTDEFHDIIALRIAVFVVEQDCPYLELDGKDKDAYHLQAINDKRLIGTLRILKPGVYYGEAAIGRVASHPDFRDLKLGHEMMKHAMRFIDETLQLNEVRLSAQTHLVHFYEKFGFKSTGKEYLEDGIPHTELLFVKS